MAIVRPPGHHAMKNEVCGFCFFNNVAIAAKLAIDKYKFNRVLIVDWDVHHGQATQYFFYDNPKVLYISFHRYEHAQFYPFLLDSNYTGVGKDKGVGFNINIPWNNVEDNNGIKDEDYLAAFFHIIMPVSYEFNPELIFVSAGFDSAEGDPLGMCHITPECYGHMINFLLTLANEKVILVLEGGYNPKSVAKSMVQCTSVLLGNSCISLPSGLCPSKNAVNTIQNVISTHKQYWSSLKFNVDLPAYDIQNTLLHMKKLESKQFGFSRNKIDIPNIMPSWCWHLQFLNVLKDDEIKCRFSNICKNIENKLICLHCFQVCYSENMIKDILHHMKERKHYFYINHSNKKIRCYGCNNEINNLVFSSILKCIAQ